MRLSEMAIGCEGIINNVAGTEKVQRFLYSIGCYPGEKVTLISILAGNYLVRIKDSRFAIDRKTAQIIELGRVEQTIEDDNLNHPHRDSKQAQL